MPKTTFEIQQNPTPTEEMPWVFQILMESDDIHPREILAVDEGKTVQGICTENGLCHAHDWAIWNYGWPGFRAHLPGEPWEPVF